jgi:hypothetical protein
LIGGNAGACGARAAGSEIGALPEGLTEQTLQAAFTKDSSFVGKGCRFKACHEDLKGNHFVQTQTQQEFEIFFSASHQFRNREVMDFQTQAGTRSSVFIAHRDDPTSPSIR